MSAHRKPVSAHKRIVIKIGSALLVDRRTGALKADWLRALAEDVAWLKTRAEVILVSSGSIALGRGALGLGLLCGAFADWREW